MSKSVNKVILVGNLTRDPETSYRQELAIAKLGIATNERRKDQSTGEWKDMPEFHNVTFFGKLGEIVEKYLKDRKSTRLNSSHSQQSRMPSSA